MTGVQTKGFSVGERFSGCPSRVAEPLGETGRQRRLHERAQDPFHLQLAIRGLLLGVLGVWCAVAKGPTRRRANSHEERADGCRPSETLEKLRCERGSSTAGMRGV
jgi:hypothetical protein